MRPCSWAARDALWKKGNWRGEDSRWGQEGPTPHQIQCQPPTLSDPALCPGQDAVLLRYTPSNAGSAPNYPNARQRRAVEFFMSQCMQSLCLHCPMPSNVRNNIFSKNAIYMPRWKALITVLRTIQAAGETHSVWKTKEPWQVGQKFNQQWLPTPHIWEVLVREAWF